MEKVKNVFKNYEHIRNLPIVSGIKDLNGVYHVISEGTARVQGWRCTEAIGKTDYDVPSKAVEAADMFVRADRITCNFDQNIKSIEVFKIDTSVMALFVQKRR